MTIDFLSIDDVLRLHELSIRRYGGADGLRDRGLMEAAVMTPQATFGGELLLESLDQMAASYLVGLVGNHPFVDGNKRTGIFAALQFLELNGVTISEAHTTMLTELTLSVAQGELKREAVAPRLDGVTSRQDGLRF